MRSERHAIRAKFYLYLFVAEVVVFLVARSLAPLGLGVNSVFAFAATYAIVIGRWVLGRKNLDASTALAMLTDALSRCHSEDMRTLEVFARSDRSRCARTRPAGLKALTLIDRYVPMRMLIP